MTTLSVFALGLLVQIRPELGPEGEKFQEVLVFRDRAVVTRVRRVACPASDKPGTSGSRFTAVFTRLPAAAHPPSLRAEASGARIDGVRVNAPDEGEAGDGDSQLDRRQQAIAEQIAAVTQQQQRLDGRDSEVLSYLATTRAVIDRQLREGRAAPATWQQAFAAVERAGRTAAAERARLAAQLERLNAERSALERQAAQDTASAANVQVIASCPRPGGQAEVRLSYMVTGASWSPSYELHTRDVGRTAKLSVFATVRQRTGEDWRAARLVLTTADPSIPATPPTLAPLDVRAEAREPPRKQVVARSEVVPRASGAQAGTTTDTGTPVRASDQGMSVRLTSTTLADVRGDGSEVQVQAAQLALPSRPALRAIPKLSDGVFQVVDVVNRAPFPLLPGPMKVFRDGDLMGTQALAQPVPPGARLSLSLGREDRVHVRRMSSRRSPRAAGCSAVAANTASPTASSWRATSTARWRWNWSTSCRCRSWMTCGWSPMRGPPPAGRSSPGTAWPATRRAWPLAARPPLTWRSRSRCHPLTTDRDFFTPHPHPPV